MIKPFALSICLGLSLISVEARAQSAGSAAAVASRTEAGATIRYSLPAPVRQVAFGDRDTIRDLWVVTTPGLTLADGAITGDQPFDAFELQLRPDAAEVDRIYMGLSRAGDGRVVYGPGLRLEGMETVLSFDLNEDEIALPASGGIEGYAYLGPAADLTRDALSTVVVGDNVAPELAAALRQTFGGALAYYRERLQADPGQSPVLVGTVDGPGPTLFRGDVTDTGVISVRFKGDVWRSQMEMVAPFVWHEAFHLWNGHGVKARNGDDAPWLHEGGADYAAVVGTVSTGALSEEAARQRLAHALNGCRRALKVRELDPARLRSGSAPYDCGLLVQWIADLEQRAAGTGNVFTLWKTMLDDARLSPTGYGVDEFRALLGSDSAVIDLFDGPAASRWTRLETRLRDLGVVLRNQPDDGTLRGTALMHVAERNCASGSYGFYDDPGALKLDGADCGPLSGEPVIATVEDHDPHAASRAMFDAVQARCAQSLPIRYRTRDGRLLEAICDRPLVEPEVWAIAEAPSLALWAPGR